MSRPSQPEPECAIPFDSASQRVFLHLWRTYDLLRSVEDECLSDFGVSAQQYNVLRILRASHPEAMPTMQLSRKMVSRGPDITRMLDRLSKNKWIRRDRPRGNRRVVEVGITDAGLDLLSEMDAAIIEMHERQLGHLKSKEKEQLIELLKIVRRPHEDNREGWLA
jgi:DNA-binding MarR family transcriptional regulator